MVANILVDYRIETFKLYAIEPLHRYHRTTLPRLLPQRRFQFGFRNAVGLKTFRHIGFRHRHNILGGVGNKHMIQYQDVSLYDSGRFVTLLRH